MGAVEDRAGRLWVATQFGLNRLDPATGRFTRFRHDPGDPGSLSHDYVYDLTVSGDGSIWAETSAADRLSVGTRSSGLNICIPEPWSCPQHLTRSGGPPSLEHDNVTDMTDDGSVLIGRAGSFFTGFTGALWIEGIGWTTWDEFFRQQGVVEASTWDFGQPLAISGSGREMVGQPAPGYPLSFFVELSQVFVCHNGRSIQTGFPNGLVNRVRRGATMGRCEFLD